MNEAKAVIRRQMRCLKALRQAEMPAESRLIVSRVERNLHFQAARTVLLYHPLPDEVDTAALIERWCRVKTVLLPVVRGDDLILREYTSMGLAKGAFGIEEPVGLSAFSDYSDIGFAAIPGMAFDRYGGRLGRGRGYYDRLLPLLRQTHKAGLCFSWQLVERVPAEPHDIAVDEVITASV